MSTDINSLLTLQGADVEALGTVLIEEHKCLEQRDTDKLSDIIQQKQLLLKSVSERDVVICQHPDAQQLKQGDLALQKQDIESQLAKCKKQNDINGKVIELSLKSARHLANVLTQARAANSMTYNNKGQTQVGSQLGGGIKA